MKTKLFRYLFFILAMIVVGLAGPHLTPISTAHAQQDDLDRLFEDEDGDDVNSFNQNNAPPPPPTSYQAPATTPTDTSGSRGQASNPRFQTPPAQNQAGVAPANQAAAKKPDPNRPSLADARIEDMTDANYPDMIESFDYPNADITDVIKAISKLTNKNFIIDPSAAHGKISIIAPTPISVAEAYKAFLSALAINQLAVVPSGKFLKIKSYSAAQTDSIDTFSGAYYPTSDSFITRIVHLKHTSSEEANKALQRLMSKAGNIQAYDPTNTLIITDYGANIERLMKIIDEIDKPGFDEQLEVILIRHAKSKELADLINQIINKDTTKGGMQQPGFGAGIPRFRPRGGTANGGTPEELSLVASDDRTNAIIVLGNETGIDKVKSLVKKLDYKLDPAEAGGVFVYYVRYGEAEKIAATLNGLNGGSSASSSSSPSPGGFGGGSFGQPNRTVSPLDSHSLFGGDVKIVPDKNTNSLVVNASKVDWETVKALLQKLDIPRDQVYVQAIIMELNSQKTNNWNPTLYYLDPSSGGIGRTGFSAHGSLANLTNPTGDTGAILGFGGGSMVNMTLPGSTTPVQIPSLLSFIQLLQSNVEGNVLSTPEILGIDGEKAEIEVGDKVPIAQDQQTTAGGVTNTNTKFEDATIHLTITPYIRPDSDVIRMQVEQVVKQPTNTQIHSQKLAESTTIISNRTIKTSIVVSNGDTAVLGGLIHDVENLDEVKIPVLGDIPILGWLFKARNHEKTKMNLVVFITPKIIRNIEDSHNHLAKKTNDRIDWVKKNFSGRDPYGEVMDKLPRSAKTGQDDELAKPRTSGKADDDQPIQPMQKQ